MTKEEILVKLQTIIATSLNNENLVLTEDTRADTILGWDSLANAMIITAIENEWNFKFKFTELMAWHTIGELAAVIEKKIG